MVFKGPAGFRLQSINSGFEGGITALGAFKTEDATQPTIIASVVRYSNVLLKTARRDADHHDRSAGVGPPLANPEESQRREPRLDASPPRGMRDVLPEEVALRDWAMAQILTVYRRHGFVRIETPAVESLRLLLRSDGGENEKLIFKILKRGEKLDGGAAAREDLADLGLRFDLTVPLARYYAHNLAKLPQPLKAIQIGPVWRAERPQQGRYRQFTQCDIDILGVASEVAEIELILATTEALAALGLKDLTVRINDRRLLGGHGRPLRVRSGAGGLGVHRARQARQDRPGRRGGRAAGGRARRRRGRPHAGPAGLERHAGRAARAPRRARGRRACGAACSASSTRSRRRRPAASGSCSTPRSCAGWATTPGPSSRYSTAEAPRRSRGAGATTGWSASSSGGTFPPPASRSGSSV